MLGCVPIALAPSFANLVLLRLSQKRAHVGGGIHAIPLLHTNHDNILSFSNTASQLTRLPLL